MVTSALTTGAWALRAADAQPPRTMTSASPSARLSPVVCTSFISGLYGRGAACAQNALAGAGEDQAEGKEVQHFGDRVGEEEDGPIHVVGHIAQLSQGVERKAPAEQARI